MITGFLLIDKAKGPTSHDVVQAVRRITGERRVGHTGTLDPFATGLLPICLGRATRLARFLSASIKTYSALVRFGFATDTYDATGRRMGLESTASLDQEALAPLLASFVGKQGQVPPPFAAKKVQGRRMYQMARAGIRVEPKPVEVVIRRINLLGVDGSRATIDVEVEAGTYIRSLAHDLGQRLGCGAHLEELRRTGVGPHNIERALSLEKLETLNQSGRLEDALMTPADALSELPWIHLSGEERHKNLSRSPHIDIGGRNAPSRGRAVGATDGVRWWACCRWDCDGWPRDHSSTGGIAAWKLEPTGQCADQCRLSGTFTVQKLCGMMQFWL